MDPQNIYTSKCHCRIPQRADVVTSTSCPRQNTVLIEINSSDLRQSYKYRIHMTQWCFNATCYAGRLRTHWTGLILTKNPIVIGRRVFVSQAKLNLRKEKRGLKVLVYLLTSIFRIWGWVNTNRETSRVFLGQFCSFISMRNILLRRKRTNSVLKVCLNFMKSFWCHHAKRENAEFMGKSRQTTLCRFTKASNRISQPTGTNSTEELTHEPCPKFRRPWGYPNNRD